MSTRTSRLSKSASRLSTRTSKCRGRHGCCRQERQDVEKDVTVVVGKNVNLTTIKHNTSKDVTVVNWDVQVVDKDNTNLFFIQFTSLAANLFTEQQESTTFYFFSGYKNSILGIFTNSFDIHSLSNHLYSCLL